MKSMPNHSGVANLNRTRAENPSRTDEEEKPIPFGEKGSPPPDPQCEQRGSREAVGGSQIKMSAMVIAAWD